MAPIDGFVHAAKHILEKSPAKAVRIVVYSLRKVGLVLSLGPRFETAYLAFC